MDKDKRARFLAENGLYSPSDEHADCGVGMIVAIDGVSSRKIVDMAIEALCSLWHRGAVDADGKTGDGAGLHVQIPQDFFKEHVWRAGREPKEGKLAVGMIFLPRNDMQAQERCRTIVESEIIIFGHKIYSWRQVPIDVSVIGMTAENSRPEIEQIMIGNAKSISNSRFETELYIMRRRIEKAVLKEGIRDFYICSLSAQSIVYKGLFLAEQLANFYPDLTDKKFISNFAIYHQRYSTNTFPKWWLAQPFHILAHNGEINTIRGNINWMHSHEARMQDNVFGHYNEDVKPVIAEGSSDSAALDSVFELLIRAGRHLPEVKSMLIPESSQHVTSMPVAHREFYRWSNSVMEPWDGPAAICGYDGRWVLGGLDRNGLRPMRYSLTQDGILILGSETGVVRLEDNNIIEKGQIGPGQMIGVDLEEKTLFYDRELKDHVASLHPFGKWAEHIKFLEKSDQKITSLSEQELLRRQTMFGINEENIEIILHPMAEDGQEPTGSMGDDSPLAVLSQNYRPFHHFFRQNFSQVTNPPIDSLRERHVMSLHTRLGNLGNILDERESQLSFYHLESPVLLDGEYKDLRRVMGKQGFEIDCSFSAKDGGAVLRDALNIKCKQAEEAVCGGKVNIFLTDEYANAEKAAIPMILAVGALHSHLVRKGLRTFCSLNVRSGECLDVHNFAVLIGVGATTVNAWLAQQALMARHEKGLFGKQSLKRVLENYRDSVDKGLLKIMSKMGISVISSYRGGYNFEAVGLSRALCSEVFPGLPSRISGIGLSGLQEKILQQHADAWEEKPDQLALGGFYRMRHSGERHGWEGKWIHALQESVTRNSYTLYKKYSRELDELPPVHLRDLLGFDQSQTSNVDLGDVEPVTLLRKRLVAPGISLGALGPEAHETLSIAMNRIGAKSDSGEGGEDPARYHLRANGDDPSSSIKQVASGRFGVTAEYLNQCSEIEIKVAQGAKPGEGGQLPGFKVSELIARLRHSTPGVTLISPPPHHDIYSIEDLAQLIYDLKQINPKAEVCVKLVARSGIGPIAAGVAKAHADIILISGHDGGTGASPQSSIKYAGLPWEIGLAEVHQVLTLNDLRQKIRLRVDGGFKTGRDVVIAALLGAEEFGIGTASLVAMGCLMVRQCHSNTCPVGICTQDESLRKRFSGTPEKVVNLFTYIAEETREIMASLGVSKFEELIGRTEYLRQISRGNRYLDDLDLNPLLVKAGVADRPNYCTRKSGRNEVPDTLDAQIIKDAEAFFTSKRKMELAYSIHNTDRTVGTRVSSEITQKFGMNGLDEDHLTIKLRGSCGQSLGAWAVKGVKLDIRGDANDYIGKGLSGGRIVIRPQLGNKRETHKNAIIGNTVLYGATAGELFAAGRAGERFAVRNSGASAVIEGCGSNACEYMTGGEIVILGSVGHNFAAGMTGGMAWVFDEDRQFLHCVNPQTVIFQPVKGDHWIERCRTLIQRHAELTESPCGVDFLENWPEKINHIIHVIPKEIIPHLNYELGGKDETVIAAE